MFALIAFNAVPLAICAALGLATGWWVFRGPSDQNVSREKDKGQ